MYRHRLAYGFLLLAERSDPGVCRSVYKAAVSDLSDPWLAAYLYHVFCLKEKVYLGQLPAAEAAGLKEHQHMHSVH